MQKKQTDKLTREFKKNLKAILNERKGITNAKKLSIAAGLGETAVRDILKDRSASPKLETIYKLSQALKVPVYRLIPSMIDHSYAELADKDEEIETLKKIAGVSYSNLTELKNIQKNM